MINGHKHQLVSKRIFLFLIIVSLVILAGCSKDKNDISDRGILYIKTSLEDIEGELESVRVVVKNANNPLEEYIETKNIGTADKNVVFCFDNLKKGISYNIVVTAYTGNNIPVFQGSASALPTMTGSIVEITLLEFVEKPVQFPGKTIEIYYKCPHRVPTIWVWEHEGIPISENMGYSWDTQPEMKKVVDDWYVFEITGEYLSTSPKALKMIFNRDHSTETTRYPAETGWYDGIVWYDEAPYQIPGSGHYPDIPADKVNNTIYQAFYWNSAPDLWKRLESNIPRFAEIGITSMWLPPAGKGGSGRSDVGYSPYDLWDLGEFDQKGTIATRWGTKSELESLLNTMKAYDIAAYYDAVLNHKLGADGQEIFYGRTAWTMYNGIGRNYYYSRAGEWSWNFECFDGDYNGLFPYKTWDYTYDSDYLMGEDIDYQNDNVKDEIKEWGSWIINVIGFDGFRLDAVKHIDSGFIQEFIGHVRSSSSKDIFVVGEAWINDQNQLIDYLNSVSNCMKVFDFPLRNDFVDLSNGWKDMRFWGGLVNSDYRNQVVTFVDNHDTCRDGNPYNQPQVIRYKNQAYCYILLRADGIPCVFAKDYEDYGMAPELDVIIKARRYFAYGPGHEYYGNDHDVYCYVREGLPEVPGDGLVFLISDGTSGNIAVKNINSRQPDTSFYDLAGHVSGIVTTDSNGYGDFKVVQNEVLGWSIWVPVN